MSVLSLSLDLQTPDSPQATTVCITLPLLESRVSNSEQYFVCWPFKREPVSLADCISPGQTEASQLFIDRCCVGTCSWFWCSRLGSPGWGLGFTPLNGNHTQQPKYPPSTSATVYRSGASPFPVSSLPTSLFVASSANPCL